MPKIELDRLIPMGDGLYKKVWFPDNTKPTRPGVYLVERTDINLTYQQCPYFWRYWDGRVWSWGESLEDKFKCPGHFDLAHRGENAYQNVRWLGLICLGEPL